MDDFHLFGDARKVGDKCIRLTEAVDWASGSIWYKKPIDLNGPFKMELQLMLGCQDRDGADGIVFVFHPHRVNLGYAGEGMGFGGLIPSLGIEIDTWQNEHLGDPAEDHIAVLGNGVVSHFYNLSRPIRVTNLETCSTQRLTISWSPVSQELTIGLNGKDILTYRSDIIKEIFRGNSEMYWGVTAATGNYNNRQEICFEKLELSYAGELLRLDPGIERRLLAGDILPLENLRFSSGRSDPLPTSLPELDKLAKLLEENPEMIVGIYGHTDSSGDDEANRSLSEARALAVARYLEGKGIAPSRLIPRGHGEQYPIASNATPLGRSQNRRVEIHLSPPYP